MVDGEERPGNLFIKLFFYLFEMAGWDRIGIDIWISQKQDGFRCVPVYVDRLSGMAQWMIDAVVDDQDPIKGGCLFVEAEYSPVEYGN